VCACNFDDPVPTWTMRSEFICLTILYHMWCLVFISYAGIDPAKEESLLEELYDRVYGNFVEEVDAVDNGISAFDGTPRCVYIRDCVYMCLSAYVCVCACVRVCVHVHVRVRVCACV
jgi:hypothetical protein